jgi:DNA-binding MarR family transcriptional regulator
MSAARLRIYHRLQLAAHRMQKSADRALLGAAHVTTAQAAVLSIAAAAGATTQREVARQLGINESAVTAMVVRLLEMGLLERSRDRADARAWQLALSKAGRSALQRVEASFAHVNATIEAVLDAHELEQLAASLARIGDAFAGVRKEEREPIGHEEGRG